MELTDILRCPKTGSKLRFDDGDSVAHVEYSDVTYPISDGIIDFCPQAPDSVSTACDAIASRYDTYMRSSNVFMVGLGVSCLSPRFMEAWEIKLQVVPMQKCGLRKAG